MSRPAKRVDFAPDLSTRRAYELTLEQRNRVEMASFGKKQHKLTEQFWEDVLVATAKFTIEDFAKHQPSTAKVNKKVDAYLKAATALRKAITGKSEDTSPFSIQQINRAYSESPADRFSGIAALYARESEAAAALKSDDLVVRKNAIHDRYFRDLGPPGDLFVHFIDVLDGSIAYARSAKASLQQKPNRGISDKSAWNDWIRELDQIVKKYGLSSGSRQDTDKGATERPSEFVLFVEALQNELPECHRRHARSRSSLAKAINEARAEFREG